MNSSDIEYRGYTITKKSKDSTHATNGSDLIKCRSVVKAKALIDAKLTVDVPVVEELTEAAPVPRKKLVRKRLKTTVVDKPKVVKRSAHSIKSKVLELITSDLSDDAIVQLIKGEFPDSKFDISHVSWYRSTLFRDGVITAEHAPRRSAFYKAWLRSTQD